MRVPRHTPLLDSSGRAERICSSDRSLPAACPPHLLLLIVHSLAALATLRSAGHRGRRGGGERGQRSEGNCEHSTSSAWRAQRHHQASGQHHSSASRLCLSASKHHAALLPCNAVEGLHRATAKCSERFFVCRAPPARCCHRSNPRARVQEARIVVCHCLPPTLHLVQLCTRPRSSAALLAWAAVALSWPHQHCNPGAARSDYKLSAHYARARWRAMHDCLRALLCLTLRSFLFCAFNCPRARCEACTVQPTPANLYCRAH